MAEDLRERKDPKHDVTSVDGLHQFLESHQQIPTSLVSVEYRTSEQVKSLSSPHHGSSTNNSEIHKRGSEGQSSCIETEEKKQSDSFTNSSALRSLQFEEHRNVDYAAKTDQIDASEQGGTFVRTARQVVDCGPVAQHASYHITAPFCFSRKSNSDTNVSRGRAERAPRKQWNISADTAASAAQFRNVVPESTDVFDPSKAFNPVYSRQVEGIENTDVWAAKKDIKADVSDVYTNLTREIFSSSTTVGLKSRSFVGKIVELPIENQSTNAVNLHTLYSISLNRPSYGSKDSRVNLGRTETSLRQNVTQFSVAGLKSPKGTLKSDFIPPGILSMRDYSNIPSITESCCRVLNNSENLPNLSPINYSQTSRLLEQESRNRCKVKKCKTSTTNARFGQSSQKIYQTVPFKMESPASFLGSDGARPTASPAKPQLRIFNPYNLHKLETISEQPTNITRRPSSFSVHANVVRRVFSTSNDRKQRSGSLSVPSKNKKFYSEYVRQKAETGTFGMLDSIREYYKLLEEKSGRSCNDSRQPMDLSKHSRVTSKICTSDDFEKEDTSRIVSTSSNEPTNYNNMSNVLQSTRISAIKNEDSFMTSSPAPEEKTLEYLPLNAAAAEHSEEAISRKTKSPSAALLMPDCQLPPKKRRMFDRCKAENLHVSEPVVVEPGVIKREPEVLSESESTDQLGALDAVEENFEELVSGKRLKKIFSSLF